MVIDAEVPDTQQTLGVVIQHGFGQSLIPCFAVVLVVQIPSPVHESQEIPECAPGNRGQQTMLEVVNNVILPI